MRTLMLATLLIWVVVHPAFPQTAPQRSDELCATLQRWASDNTRTFRVTSAGACMVNIDAGYDFIVSYNPDTLLIGLSMNPILLGHDVSAFWLRLSSFDNLVHSAMGTKQQKVFDEMNKMVKRLAQVELEALTHSTTLPTGVAPECPVKFFVSGKTDHAILAAACDQKTGLAIFMASATVKDIEKMKTEASSAPSAWRTILALSLQAFAAGANAYSQRLASQPIYRMQTSCYTNFLGRVAITHCY